MQLLAEHSELLLLSTWGIEESRTRELFKQLIVIFLKGCRIEGDAKLAQRRRGTLTKIIMNSRTDLRDQVVYISSPVFLFQPPDSTVWTNWLTSKGMSIIQSGLQHLLQMSSSM